MRFLKNLPWKALLLILLFSFFYLLLSITKHNNFLSGYDLAVSDQVMWKYAVFHNPLTTIHAYPFTYMFEDHIEFIYVFLSPLFWIWNDVRILIIAQVVLFCLSGLPMYLLAKWKGLSELLSLTLLFSYLFFFGVQNALWNDVHSNVFGVAAIAWLIYFLESGKTFWTFVAFFFAITAKEDMAFLTGAIGVVWLVINIRTVISSNARDLKERFLTFVRNDNVRVSCFIILSSLIYLFLVFGVFFPHFTSGYRFASHEPLLQSLNPTYFADTLSKRQIIAYSLGWFGFLPLFAPLYLLPWLADLFHFFVIGHVVESAQEIFLHYRISLAPLLLWPTIMGIQKISNFKFAISNKKRATFLLFLLIAVPAIFLQYSLHLPLSYLTKSWFWHTPASVASLNRVLTYLPKDASVVSQNNITPHIGHRDNIFTLWPDVRTYKSATNSPCGKELCRWFHWVGNPHYMIVDTGPDWDIRHFLANRPDYLEALQNFEHMGKIQVYKRDGTTTLYKILQQP
ncbi:MAG TPA: DUF2079 domain-containing protein [Candidatus Eisenbacteria bacterium]|nr:DUF2079 domain-containing protein [Candidatus Eisenbacteria bacterium]